MARPAVRFLTAAVLCVAVVIAGTAIVVWKSYTSVGPLQKTARVIIPKGAGVREIADLLVGAGIIKNVYTFVLGARYTEVVRRMRAGEFEFSPGVSMHDAARVLVRGKTVKRRITVPEGLLTVEVLGLVAATKGLVGPVAPWTEEGRFLPETYFFSYGDTRYSVLIRMEEAMDRAIAEAWERRSKPMSLRSSREALILASIIEKETGIPSERSQVSGVFHNRLRMGMRLQSDPCVAYALTGGKKPLERLLTRKDLRVVSNYNTYRIQGLPPGPISNPGKAALLAAVNPIVSDHLYFVADGKGGHVFTKTLEDHNRSVRKLRLLQLKDATSQ